MQAQFLVLYNSVREVDWMYLYNAGGKVTKLSTFPGQVRFNIYYDVNCSVSGLPLSTTLSPSQQTRYIDPMLG